MMEIVSLSPCQLLPYENRPVGKAIAVAGASET
jgi:hypothetical protein